MSTTLKFSLSHGLPAMDSDKITEMLKDAFWCIGITKNEVIRGAQNSALVVGAFTQDNIQIGYARVISDKIRFAYVLDVIVGDR